MNITVPVDLSHHLRSLALMASLSDHPSVVRPLIISLMTLQLHTLLSFEEISRVEYDDADTNAVSVKVFFRTTVVCLIVLLCLLL
jgi:hypothetical protein